MVPLPSLRLQTVDRRRRRAAESGQTALTAILPSAMPEGTGGLPEPGSCSTAIFLLSRPAGRGQGSARSSPPPFAARRTPLRLTRRTEATSTGRTGAAAVRAGNMLFFVTQ